MNCASCGAGMTALTLDGHFGTRVELDLCFACQVIWFDHLESVRLSPGGTLRLFRMIGERGQFSPAPIKQLLRCPRCELRLLLAQDRQRNTPFRYWRCPREHGRLTTFVDFLREKDFVRPLSPHQLADLRQNVQTINCSNCGAPIDLVHASSCSHCGTPISMLDVSQIARMAEEVRRVDEQPAATPAGKIPSGQAEGEHQDVRALFDALRAHETWDRSSSFGLVEAGLWMISLWLT